MAERAFGDKQDFNIMLEEGQTTTGDRMGKSGASDRREHYKHIAHSWNREWSMWLQLSGQESDVRGDQPSWDELNGLEGHPEDSG